MKLLKVRIFGDVQGVFFRQSAKAKADTLGLKGFARNEPDNSLYIEAEGEDSNLKEFLEWCRKGPELARIRKIDFNFEKTPRNFSGFGVE